MATCSPIYDPAQAFTGRATGAAVTGRRLLKVAAAKTDGEPVPVAHCGASDQPIGVSQKDAADTEVLGVYPPGMVLPIECAANVAAGAAVEITTDGKVQTLASGRRVGVAFSAGTTSVPALVQLQF